jgi:5-methylcytosine-specific restriction endonuclease McrA
VTKRYPKAFLARLRAVEAKRPKTVIEFILKHGSITTEQLKELGYNHPPRAARDVREQGIPLVTTRVPDSTGRMIGTYTFGDPNELVPGLTGRTAISKAFKKKLIELNGPTCAVCRNSFEDRYLQTDHRVPVEVGGDEPDDERDVADYMLLDGGCNRAKSWSCENCENFTAKDLSVCATCYWAIPDRSYEHVATIPERRTQLVWRGDNVPDYDDLVRRADEAGQSVPEYVKDRLREDSG